MSESSKKFWKSVCMNHNRPLKSEQQGEQGRQNWDPHETAALAPQAACGRRYLGPHPQSQPQDAFSTFDQLVQFSRVRLFATPWTAAHQASLSITNSRSLLKLMSIELVVPSNHLILCHPLLPPSIFSSIRVFPNKSVLRIRWPKYWSFSFSISPCNEHSGLISFRMDWLDLLAVQRTLKSLRQHHGSKASVLWRSAFIIVQLSHSYKTTGKTMALTRQTFVGKVMSLLFNMLPLWITREEKANSFSAASVPGCCSHCWGLRLRPLPRPQQAEVGVAARSLPMWHGGEGSICQGRRCRFNPQVRTMLWRRKWLPTLVFLPGLEWEISWTEEPGRLQSTESKESWTCLSMHAYSIQVRVVGS